MTQAPGTFKTNVLLTSKYPPMNIHDFDDIRPFEPEELPAAFDRLLADPQFMAVLPYVLPAVPVNLVAEKMRDCHDSLEFQKTFCYGFLVT